jgi:uncharacterized protein
VFVSVQDLQLRTVPFSIRFQPGQLDLLDSALRLRNPLLFEGVAELGGGDEIRVRGRISAVLEVDCDRCAEPYAVPVEGPVKLSYQPALEDAHPGSEHEIHAGDTEVGFYDGPGIDLTDVAREQVLLWLPMQRLCGPECKGICPVCGQNRNVADCQCGDRAADPRWDALRRLSVK